MATKTNHPFDLVTEIKWSYARLPDGSWGARTYGRFEDEAVDEDNLIDLRITMRRADGGEHHRMIHSLYDRTDYRNAYRRLTVILVPRSLEDKILVPSGDDVVESPRSYSPGEQLGFDFG